MLSKQLQEIPDDAAPANLAGAAVPFRRITPSAAGEIRRELLRLGYDGIVVGDGGGDGIDYDVALTAESVKVVRP